MLREIRGQIMAAETIVEAADSSLERVREWSTISYRDMDSSIEHSRWMTTLCMAEIAAIAGYNELEGVEFPLSASFRRLGNGGKIADTWQPFVEPSCVFFVIQ